MKSGLEDRNNTPDVANLLGIHRTVSMKSGLEDRNNMEAPCSKEGRMCSLNEVRPGRPEQCPRCTAGPSRNSVSMKSGLEDRNNGLLLCPATRTSRGLNEVRPGRPEQYLIRRY